MPIARRLPLAMGAIVLAGSTAMAQSDVAPGRADPYAHDPYITSSGATVAHPGQSQSGGTTPQERAIQRQNNKIDKEICKGC